MNKVPELVLVIPEEVIEPIFLHPITGKSCSKKDWLRAMRCQMLHQMWEAEERRNSR